MKAARLAAKISPHPLKGSFAVAPLVLAEEGGGVGGLFGGLEAGGADAFAHLGEEDFEIDAGEAIATVHLLELGTVGHGQLLGGISERDGHEQLHAAGLDFLNQVGDFFFVTFEAGVAFEGFVRKQGDDAFGIPDWSEGKIQGQIKCQQEIFVTRGL